MLSLAKGAESAVLERVPATCARQSHARVTPPNRSVTLLSVVHKSGSDTPSEAVLVAGAALCAVCGACVLSATRTERECGTPERKRERRGWSMRMDGGGQYRQNNPGDASTTVAFLGRQGE